MEKDSKLIAELTLAIYSVIGKTGLEYNKDNAKKVIDALASICSTFCMFSDLDFDEFISNAKEIYETDSKDDGFLSIKEEFKNKAAKMQSSKKETSNVESLSGFKDKKFVKDSVFGRDVSFAQTMFEDIYSKMMDIMQDKNLLTTDMPVMIGCLGAVGAYFSEIYDVDKDLITKTITEYYKSLENYDKLNDVEKEKVLSSYQPKENLKDEFSKDATVINFPSKKGPYNLN